MSAQAPPGGRGLIRRLVALGWLEIVLASLLGILALLLDLANNQPWQVLALDLGACIAAGATARWPRAAGTALGVALGAYLLVPRGWATMGEYAPLIPILATGMAGRRRPRAVMSGVYYLLLAAVAWRDAPTPASAMLGWLVWAVLIAGLWLIGNAFHAVTLAYESARAADRILQRDRVTLALHDTVARSLTRMIMDSERARLHGDPPERLVEQLTAGAEKSLQDVRLVMTLLREPPPDDDTSAVAHTPLGEALRMGAGELRSRGMAVTTAVHGDLARLTDTQSGVLGAAAAEAIHNIVKHADPGLPCAIIVDVTPDAVELAFVNGRAGDAGEPRQGDAHGLWGVAHRLQQLDGEVSTEQIPDQWITRVRLPLGPGRNRPTERFEQWSPLHRSPS